MSSFCNLYPITAMQFMFGKLFPEIMFMVHVVFTCLWFMLNGLERFCHFSLGVSSQSPLPSSCLEYGGLQCSHIFIICCVLYCFQFSFMVYFISWCLLMCYLFSFIFIYVHLFSFMFIYFHLFSFIFIYCNFFSFFNFLFFFSLEKTITNLNHLHVDPRLSSADVILFSEPIPYVYIYIIRRTYSIFFETNCCLFLGKTCFEQGVI